MPKKKTSPKGKKATAKKPAAKASKKSNKSLPLSSNINKPIKFKNPIRVLVISVVFLLVACLVAWWQFIFAEPGRVLSDMLVGNLRTSGVVRTVQQGADQNTIEQNTYLSFLDGPKLHSTREQTTSTNRTVIENISTTNDYYVRYKEIDIINSELNLDTAAVEGVWASQPGGGPINQQTNIINQGLIGLVGFGNFNQADSDFLKDTIDEKEVYKYTSVNKKFEDGRLVYVYNVEILPAAWFGYMAEYVKLMGLDDQGQLESGGLDGAPAFTVELKVDVLSRQLLSIENKSTGVIEQYGGFGLKRQIEIPQGPISVSELQQRLQVSQ
jgi:hypothetical protein